MLWLTFSCVSIWRRILILHVSSPLRHLNGTIYKSCVSNFWSTLGLYAFLQRATRVGLQNPLPPLRRNVWHTPPLRYTHGSLHHGSHREDRSPLVHHAVPASATSQFRARPLQWRSRPLRWRRDASCDGSGASGGREGAGAFRPTN
jgi:hypothetical protein